jgi:hypothetical protein
MPRSTRLSSGGPFQGRITKAAKLRRVDLPDPDEFVELMSKVRRRKREKE